jgi:hypothetical protein
VNISDLDSSLKREIDAIMDSPSLRAIQEAQRMMEVHLRPLEDVRLRIEEMTAPLRDIGCRMKDLTAGWTSSVTDQALASSATACLASIPSALDQLTYRSAFEAMREISATAKLIEPLRPIVPERIYEELPTFGPFISRKDAEITELRDRVEDLEAEVEDLKTQLNPPVPEQEEGDDRPSPGQYL